MSSITVGSLMQILLLTVSLHFVSLLNDSILTSAVGLSSLIISCGGGTLISGCNLGCSAFIGRAHGS